MSNEHDEHRRYRKAQYAETLKTIDQQIVLKKEEGVAHFKIGEDGWKVLTNNGKNYNHIIGKSKGFVTTSYEIGKEIYDAMKTECNQNL